MTCPACGGELVKGGARCPVCDTPVAPRVEGALAADPRLVTPPARGRGRGAAPPDRSEPTRDTPGMPRDSREARDAREAERSWRDEVRERVRSRRQRRVDSGLPLFDSVADTPLATPPIVPPDVSDVGNVELKREASELPAPRTARLEGVAELGPPNIPEPVPEGPTQLGPTELGPIEPASAASDPQEPPPAPRIVPMPPPQAHDADLFSPGLSEEELADLPLRTAVPARETPAAVAGTPEPAFTDSYEASPRVPESEPAAEPPSLDDEILVHEAREADEVELPPPDVEPSPVERPAHALERAQAAAFDLAVFVALGSVVVYFAGRAARVEVTGLLSAWPWLVSFLGVLAVFYAGYFTGTTGQTPGKLITGLRVVGTSGRPPEYPRAAARALTGLLGVLTAGAGLLPIVFDPARRALHDRLFRTRVIRR